MFVRGGRLGVVVADLFIGNTLCTHQDINAAWRELEGAEKTYQEFLLSELRR